MTSAAILHRGRLSGRKNLKPSVRRFGFAIAYAASPAAPVIYLRSPLRHQGYPDQMPRRPTPAVHGSLDVFVGLVEGSVLNPEPPPDRRLDIRQRNPELIDIEAFELR